MLSRRVFLAASAVPVFRCYGQGSNMFGDAEAYERFMGRWSRLLVPQFVDFTDVPDGGRVLDVGSGTGSLAFGIAERKTRCRVLGIDPAKEYIAYADSRNPFPKRASFEVGDAQQMRFANASFDASLSLLVFNFIPDAAKALREVRRVTKPGGRISAAVWDYGEGMRMLRAFWDAAVSINAKAEKVDEKQMPLCRAGELSELWRRGGLENVQEKPLTITTRFTNFADYWDPFLLGQGPAGAVVKSFSSDQVQALRRALKSRVSPSAENTPIELSARVWAVRGSVPAGG
ncbi:MAG TPA: class I SAM-dependent methyltransferase [Bryobacteraceae bacterium]|nr:class I SAM-dependent methyltransferase [Bryobacteraceae bacterium]